MSTLSIVITSSARTAVGSFSGEFANTPAHELGAAVIGVRERAGVDAGEVDKVVLGQVLPAGEGQNPARQAAIKAGIPQEATAWFVNQLCGVGPAFGCDRYSADCHRRCENHRRRGDEGPCHALRRRRYGHRNVRGSHLRAVP